MEREQTTIQEATKFIHILKGLNKEQQNGLYLIIKGAAVIAGEKKTVFE